MLSQSQLSEKIIKAAMEVHNELGYGLLESTYKKALIQELQDKGLKAEEEKKIDIYYKGYYIGTNFIDLLVTDTFIVEIKTHINIIKPHFKQVRQYLKATGFSDSIILNFAPVKLQFKRVFLP